MSSENEKNEALKKAVENEDFDTVRQLLDKGADPNYLHQPKETVFRLAIAQGNIEIIKLLLQYGANLDADSGDDLAEYIMRTKNSDVCKDVIAHATKFNYNVEFLENCLFHLSFSAREFDESTELEVFKFLLDIGLPTDEFMNGEYTNEGDSYTVLHYSIMENKVHFVQELLKRGADIHKKTGDGFNCISVSLSRLSESMIKLLLEKGVEINEKFDEGKTPLHQVCEIEHCGCPENVHILCKYGADVNILDDFGYTPIMCSNLEVDQKTQIAMLEELAKLKFEGQFICPENISYIAEEDFEDEDDIEGPGYLQTIFDDCLEELQRMKNQKFYKDVTLYDIVKMSKHQKKKLIFWTKRMDFVDAFKSGWERKLFKHYAEYLEDLFKDALEVRDLLKTEEEQLHSIFKDCLPAMATRKLAFFRNEHLIF